ncbi:hypothetical protein BOTBODRAFT_30518 [Botryobasidium botryosum FD-172 SS1]|uniref:RTA1 like protein n=1 Tax=Botryobasidium botryosum (strain FD-172 SS1) TaxID=930990 RepID=A0A067MXH1_BOTB1|nr:hypothetical protein BOTBODRAFT_30518 [Botryobasidium botryosum FD-172 SS1]
MNSTATTEIPYGTGSPYHYVPTLWVCATLLVLFSLTGILHLIQAIWTRRWWLIPTVVVCAIGEVIGWSGRLWSSQNSTLRTPFLMQISSTIIAPSFVSAALFVTLGYLVNRLGPQYSRLGPKLYAIIFCSVDVVSLVIQAIGGGMASSADNLDGAENGAHVMLGGIVLQLVAITFYVVFAAEFVTRFYKDWPIRHVSQSDEGKAVTSASGKYDKPVRLVMIGIIFSSVFLYIRAIYRTIELSNGWNGRIISTQTYFNVLDGVAILLAMLVLNIFHPGHLLNRIDSVQLSPTVSLSA